MYGGKLLWTGLTISLALEGLVPDAKVVGGVIMVIGCVLFWFDR